ncbi:malate dehydrogenase-like [Vanessa cardui]|uniref:malate dehydrogenase-like n=1 Tax=Vanessa cardui TaxID=171605 RepID=UPI001F12B08F|nr:malate dehydrogenase-like [Vanessa cardui]
MLQAKKCLHIFCRKVLSRNYHVAIVGGASEIGQTIALLLRNQRTVSNLVIHDNAVHTPGIVLDLSHIPTNSAIKGYVGSDSLDSALQHSDIVITTGAIQSPGLSEKARLHLNAEFIKSFATRVSKVSPIPFIGIATEPINVMVPMATEVIRNNGEYDPKKIFGITSADLFTAQTMYASINNINPQDCKVPVIGGHSNETVIPLLSQAKPACNLDQKSIEEFTAKFRSQEDLVTNAKKGWSPTLSIAYGVSIFVQGILNALDGRPNQIHAYVENNDFGTSYFAGTVLVDEKGAGEMERYSNLSDFECHLLERAIEQLRKDVSKGTKMLELA